MCSGTQKVQLMIGDGCGGIFPGSLPTSLNTSPEAHLWPDPHMEALPRIPACSLSPPLYMS